MPAEQRAPLRDLEAGRGEAGSDAPTSQTSRCARWLLAALAFAILALLAAALTLPADTLMIELQDVGIFPLRTIALAGAVGMTGVTVRAAHRRSLLCGCMARSAHGSTHEGPMPIVAQALAFGLWGVVWMVRTWVHERRM